MTKKWKILYYTHTRKKEMKEKFFFKMEFNFFYAKFSNFYLLPVPHFWGKTNFTLKLLNHHYVKLKINNTQKNNAYWLFVDQEVKQSNNKQVQRKLAQNEMVIHWELCQRLKFDHINVICPNQNLFQGTFSTSASAAQRGKGWIYCQALEVLLKGNVERTKQFLISLPTCPGDLLPAGFPHSTNLLSHIDISVYGMNCFSNI